MLTNGQTDHADGHCQSRGLLLFKNWYVLLWTPNGYRNMLMRIFMHCLIFQCVFNYFQCVITLLHALSVALAHKKQ